MDVVNTSIVSEFVLLGLSSSWELQVLFFMAFSLLYVATLVGNSLLVLTVIADSHLHLPMYFLLTNLSIIDMSLASFATLKMIIDYLSGLACVDTYILGLFMISTSGIIALSCFVVLFTSYVIVLVTIKRHSSRGSSKALSTCTAHFIVVFLFFGPCICIYMWPQNSFLIEKVLSVFYTIFTPILNPVIYSLRNQEVKTAMKKLKNRFLNSNKATPSHHF
ncbi:Olfactory receptor 4K2 [Sciurus carolinensis]|uniref:Olfactory receptor 4K2 n=1 Tax=Sciurus carolinensis TaxID=30640 RepID=A0AA41MC10_SCICA|nr:Olfactory receptor 4K2 [Sciurus carolinensis]